jgi:transcriptional regulator GlxA family with amidase domain
VQELGHPVASAGYAARNANLSTRQLRRRFDDHVGLPPKTLHAILRFQRLRAWLASPSSGVATLARGAADCGYFDQAHMCREYRRPAAVATLRQPDRRDSETGTTSLRRDRRADRSVRAIPKAAL